MIYDKLTPEFELLCWANGIDLSIMEKGVFVKFAAAVPVLTFDMGYKRDLFFINGQQYAFAFKKGNFTDVYFGPDIESVLWFDRSTEEFFDIILGGRRFAFDEGFFTATIGKIST